MKHVPQPYHQIPNKKNLIPFLYSTFFWSIFLNVDPPDGGVDIRSFQILSRAARTVLYSDEYAYSRRRRSVTQLSVPEHWVCVRVFLSFFFFFLFGLDLALKI